MVIQQAMGLPAGHGAEAAAFLAAFVEDMKAAGFVADALARLLGCSPSEVLVASTGVIGVNLKMDKVLAGVDAAHAALSSAGGEAAAQFSYQSIDLGMILGSLIRREPEDIAVIVGELRVRKSHAEIPLC